MTRRDLHDTIQSLLQDAGLCRTRTKPAAHTTEPKFAAVFLWKIDGKFRRLPEDFEFPQFDAFGVWRLWWFGNPARKYPPFRALQPTDFTVANRKTYSEWTVLVGHVTKGAQTVNGAPVPRPQSEEEADAIFRVWIANVPMKAAAQQHKS